MSNKKRNLGHEISFEMKIRESVLLPHAKEADAKSARPFHCHFGIGEIEIYMEVESGNIGAFGANYFAAVFFTVSDISIFERIMAICFFIFSLSALIFSLSALRFAISLACVALSFFSDWLSAES